MLGYESREDMLDHPLSDFLIQPEQWEAEQRELAAVRLDPAAMKSLLRRRDGSTVTCLHAAALIRDTGGRVRRHREPRWISPSAARWNSACTASRNSRAAWWKVSPTWSWRWTARAAIRLSVRASRELLGFAPEEMIGTSLGERMDPQDRKQVRALFESMLAGERTEGTIEYLTQRKDGEMRLFRASASPLFEASGTHRGRHRLRPRHHRSQAHGAAVDPDRATRRHGPDDRRSRPRIE